ncbi:MAG: hypothetical protein A3I24_03225 [Candidatus Harrisonbacteria bacterium RIFCSPLOWO2_02_FULL_41_13b]|uniref:Uncharacterized protein n=1 Tax=Candidatus Harrisonbacteria bacterium RIFCSPLOWO2_02_FULL_41_13b TaxID=1798409 RepID=A0A1G1ZU21_9BACT|nr:MAG: hypothetical protein A3J53_01420 [Candidatus Harrisonbacteria bacterium RIFCSPHIGHO2_02_FULL_40_20]OGY67981.1 MAG: hypothetical protein A3I24_03225 [Candidatus Harrisonbacteria bacterium RIFCSPLOWO2_02_FULL_41_13b]
MATKVPEISGQIREFHKSKWTWIAMVVSLLVLLTCSAIKKHGKNKPFDGGAGPPVVIQPAPAPMLVLQPKLEMREIPIQPNCWSEMIEIDPNDKWTLSRPGWIEYLLEDRGRIYVADGTSFDAKKMCGDRFRIRGAQGIAKMFIEH